LSLQPVFQISVTIFTIPLVTEVPFVCNLLLTQFCEHSYDVCLGDNETPSRDGKSPFGDDETPSRDGKSSFGDNETPSRDGKTPFGDDETPSRDGKSSFGDN